MKKNSYYKVALSFFTLCAIVLNAADFTNQVKWVTQVKDGYFTDLANWTGVTAIPTNKGQCATIELSQNGDYTIRFPEGVTTNYAAFYVVGFNNQSKSITIDTTQGALYQAPSTYQSDWQGFGFYVTGTSHFFNFESLKKDASEPVCSFNGGQIQAKLNNGKYCVDILSGTLDWSSPYGNPTTASLLPANQQGLIRVHEDATLKAGITRIRGGAFEVLGGNQYFNSTFRIGDGYSHRELKYTQYSGTVEHNGDMLLASHSNTISRVDFLNDSVYRQRSEKSFYSGYEATAESYVNVCDNAKVVVGQLITAYKISEVDGVTSDAKSEVVISDNGEMTLLGSSVIGKNTGNSRSLVKVIENGKLTAENQLNIGVYGATGKGELIVEDSASFTAKKAFKVEHDSIFTLGGNASFTYLGVPAQGGAFTVEGGAFTLADDATFVMATNRGCGNFMYVYDGGRVEFNGGTSYLAKFIVGGGGGVNVTNVMKVTGGYHIAIQDLDDTGWVPFTVGAQNSHALFEMTGGTVVVPRIARVGYNTTGSGSAILRMKGGLLDIVPESSGHSSVLNVCDSTASEGRLELLGGKIRAQEIRGWTGARNKGGTGWAALYANGGTVSPNNKTSGIISTFDEAVLGENGLTVDTEGRSISINHAFTDEEGKSGLFVKAGEGVLTVKKVSDHANTRVEGGELFFEVPSYGKNLEVINNSVVSTVGNSTGFSVETLTVGSDDSVGYIKIDNGDIITVTKEDGFNPINAVIICDGMTDIGEYNIFNIKVSENYDRTKFNNVRLLSSNKDRRFSFNAVENGDGTLNVKLSVSAVDVTDARWVGGNGNSWSEAANWSVESVPNENTVAEFPAEVSDKNVNIDSPSKAREIKLVGGDWKFNGESILSLDKMTLLGGSLEVKNTVKANVGMEIDIPDSSYVSFGGPIESLTGQDVITKNGDGRMELNVNSLNYLGSWVFNAGKTVVNAPSGLGDLSSFSPTVKIGAGTVVFSNETENTEYVVSKKLKVDSGTDRVAIVEAVNDVEFTAGMETVSGGLVKSGSGKMTVKFDNGTTTISKTSFGVGSNGVPGESIEFTENGSSPTASAQFGGLSVVEGVLRFEGAGANLTTLNQLHATLIGGKGLLNASARMEVANLTYNQGGSGIHCFIGGTLTDGSAATNCVLSVAENAVFKGDTIKVGNLGHSGCTTPCEHVLAVTNASVKADWAMIIGTAGDVNIKGVLNVGKGGIVETLKTTSAGSCFDIQGVIGGEVSDGGMLCTAGAISYGLYVHNSSGRIDFVRGGRLCVPAISEYVHDSDSYGLTIGFDGGVFDVNGSGRISAVKYPARHKMSIASGGMEMSVNGSHTVAMPIDGEGGLVKTGAGNLHIAKSISISNGATNLVDGVITANWTGKGEVRQGSMTIESDAAREDLNVAVSADAELRIAGDQILGKISGAGKVVSSPVRSSPGETPFLSETGAAISALSCKIELDIAKEYTRDTVPLFENITLSNVVVDCASEEAESVSLPATFPVARIGEGVTIDIAKWKSVNRPSLTAVEFQVRDGVVYATLYKEGFILLLK